LCLPVLRLIFRLCTKVEFEQEETEMTEYHSSGIWCCRQVAITCSPRACSWRQYSRPMPRLEPVMRKVFKAETLVWMGCLDPSRVRTRCEAPHAQRRPLTITALPDPPVEPGRAGTTEV